MGFVREGTLQKYRYFKDVPRDVELYATTIELVEATRAQENKLLKEAEATIENLSHDGRGIAHINGKTLLLMAVSRRKSAVSIFSSTRQF